MKYDDPESAKEIPSFIKFHGLNVDELLDSLDSFSEFSPLLYLPLINVSHELETFNQFFYRFVLSSFNQPHICILESVFPYFFSLRKLKPSARPIDAPSDAYRLVSSADCRLLTFETVSYATRLWIKGREFTIARLLGDAYKDDVERYTGGALAIFRLAPQDYHRFHSPVEGRIGRMTYIAGEYYTVNVRFQLEFVDYCLTYS
jgi:phosphatidylserine decarboxylase